MRKYGIIIFTLFLINQLQAQTKQWGFWKELPKHAAEVSFLHAHQKRLYVGDKQGGVYIYRVDGQGYKKIHYVEAHEGAVSHIETSPNGNVVATAGYDGWVRLYNTKDFLLVKEFKNAKVEDYDGTKGLESTFATFSKSGNQLFIGGYNRHVVAVDLAKGTSDIVFFDSTYAVTCGEVIASRNLLAFGFGGEVHFYDTKSGELANFAFGKHGAYQDFVCEVAYIPHKDWLSVWLVSGSIRIYDLRSRQLVTELAVSNQEGSCRVAVSPDGHYLATGNAPEVSIYQLKNKQLAQTLDKHQKTVGVSTFLLGGNILATGGDDRKVMLWKKGTGNTKNDDIVLKGVPSRFKVGEVFVLENLQFDQSSYALRKEAVQELNNLKKVLHQHPNMEIVLEGHTSNEGDEAKNMELSKQRLESARNYLIARGIDADRVGVKAFGETKPRADNSTIAGRIANRRIEMRIVKL